MPLCSIRNRIESSGLLLPLPKAQFYTSARRTNAQIEGEGTETNDHAINPPASTLPAPLDLGERRPDQSRFNYLRQCGKKYWHFYKTGVKHIFANRRLAKVAQSRIQEEARKYNASRDEEEAPMPIYGGTPDAWKIKLGLTRAEHQLILRSRQELLRLPILAALLLIFGEWLPLLVISMTPLVPPNCRIPKQVERARRKLTERRIRERDRMRRAGHYETAFDGQGNLTKHLPAMHVVSAGFVHDSALAAYRCLHVGILNPTLLPFVHFAYSNTKGANLRPDLSRFKVRKTNLVLAKVQKRIDALMLDTIALFKSGLCPDEIAKELSDREVEIAAEERGIIVSENPDLTRKDLACWLRFFMPPEIRQGGSDTRDYWLNGLLESISVGIGEHNGQLGVLRSRTSHAMAMMAILE